MMSHKCTENSRSDGVFWKKIRKDIGQAKNTRLNDGFAASPAAKSAILAIKRGEKDGETQKLKRTV